MNYTCCWASLTKDSFRSSISERGISWVMEGKVAVEKRDKGNWGVRWL